MENEYIKMFSVAKLYELVKEDTLQADVCPFETVKIKKSFCEFCEKWLDKGFKENDTAAFELNCLIQDVKENAFFIGFKIAVNLMR